ncbi:MAG TPA: transcription-repair coupling factor [Patescibacteria group bacterium]|nr:transcription-repair coupling factor [Patescibacteria group bacterium]
MNTSITRVGQVPNPVACAHYIATSPLFKSRAAFVVLESESDRHLLSSLLPYFDTEKRPVIEWKNKPFQLLEMQHLLVPSFIIADRKTILEEYVPSPTAFTKQSFHIQPSEKISPMRLRDWLARAGFEPETSANAAGCFAFRGDIVDVYTSEPIRIQFFGDTVETIHTFHLKTGKLSKQLSSVLIPPVQLVGRASILDHLPNNSFVVVFHQKLLEIDKEQIALEPFTLNEEGALNAGYQETKAYHLRYEEMQEDIKDKKAYVFTYFVEKARNIFAAVNPQTQIQRFQTTARGCVNATQNLIILTDASIGFEEEKLRKQSARVNQALVQQLSPGDHAVHLYHGIGRFIGTKIMHVNGLDREYFILEYAEGDKIYVPVELAERIDKYVGDPNPKLHRLSDASWSEVVARVQKESLVLAHELLELYARRSFTTAPSLVECAEESVLDKKCPFTLTKDQVVALQDIFHGLAQEKPMDRLLCGDVGFGKTEIAIRAAFRAVLNGYQVALLAPTTILAQQHLDTFTERLNNFGVHVRALNRLRSPKEQKEVVHGIANGTVDIVIGTHRLLSKDVQFKHLGLIVVDEEQRFGVKAKEGLKRIRKNAHVLTMTATPIPRTLHLSLSGIRDISTILTPPQERKAVETSIQQYTPKRVQEAIERELHRGGQTYYVYNRVESIHHRLLELQCIIPQARIGIAHGQMVPKELAHVMHQFDCGEIDVLLATTIVENGLDIPRANTIIVENASMFGLSELYQLRGRVGRSTQQGYAYFLYTEQIPEADAKKRFIALQDAQELGAGFELAMKDMEIRGVGNMLGKEQHGHATKVGLNLYVRLLNQAVRNLEGVPEEIERDIPIDLPLEARIPEELIPDNGERIMLYQRLAIIRDREELKAKRVELTKSEQFQKDGELHPAVSGLFDVLEIKLLASHSHLLSITTAYPSKHNNITSPCITLTSEIPFTEVSSEWEHVFTRGLDVNKIRATVEELGVEWIQKIQQVIQSVSSIMRSKVADAKDVRES